MSKSSRSKSSNRKPAVLAMAPAVMFSVALIIMAVVVDAVVADDSPFAQEFKAAVTRLVITGVIVSVLLFGGLGFLATRLASSASKRADDDPSGDNYRRYVEGEYGHLILH